MQQTDRGKIVTAAGFGVNLCLGVLYAWGVISAALIDHLEWTVTQTQLPYMVACAFFAISMVPAGRLQDRLGPRLVIVAAALITGLGLFISGLTMTVMGKILGFGILFGIGMGLGYAAPTPAAVKWFGRHRRGLVSGLVVSGFGLAPLFMGPLTNWMISLFGIRGAFIGLGALFLTAILILSRFITNPPAGFVPQEKSAWHAQRAATLALAGEWNWRQVLRTKQFYILWVAFCFGTFAGLLIIGQMSKLGLEKAGITTPFLLTGIYAIANTTGRVSLGLISDRLGRERTLFMLFVAQVFTYIAFPYLRQPVTLILGISVVGLTFGGMLTIFPAITADYYGLRGLGVNYGLVFTAWGIGGVLGPLMGGVVRDVTGTYVLSYVASAVLSAIGAWLALQLLPSSKNGGSMAPVLVRAE
jgi:OFA family oxalate/formate antiporter-like MFS transporter